MPFWIRVPILSKSDWYLFHIYELEMFVTCLHVYVFVYSVIQRKTFITKSESRTSVAD